MLDYHINIYNRQTGGQRSGSDGFYKAIDCSADSPSLAVTAPLRARQGSLTISDKAKSDSNQDLEQIRAHLLAQLLAHLQKRKTREAMQMLLIEKSKHQKGKITALIEKIESKEAFKQKVKQ